MNSPKKCMTCGLTIHSGIWLGRRFPIGLIRLFVCTRCFESPVLWFPGRALLPDGRPRKYGERTLDDFLGIPSISNFPGEGGR